MSTTFDLFLVLHLLFVIAGTGYLAYSGITLVAGRRRGAALSTLEVNTQLSMLAELCLYGAFLFGMAAIGSSDKLFEFSQTWVWVSIILFVLLLGVLHGMIRPNRRRYLSAARALAATGPTDTRPPEVDIVANCEKKLSIGWGVFNALVIALVCMMVVKPGGPF